MKKLESILTDLTYVESMFGDNKNFHGTFTFDKQKSFTDIFLEAKNKEISDEQLNKTLERIKNNNFNNNFNNNYLNTVEIEFIKNSELKDLEIKNII